MNKFGETLGRGSDNKVESLKKIDAYPYNPLSPPNTYRNNDNPQYWNNRKPYKGYWQQDVHYKIKANIDEKTDIIGGTLKLTYWNNSPEDLDHVFFHLYQNAFQPGSYYDNLQENNQVKPRYGKYEKQKLGTVITQLKAGGVDVESDLDNTILKVDLPQTLSSGDSITFTIDFKTYFDNGGVRRRMKTFVSWGYKHYDGVHWYPRISVYDKKFGWTTDQHLGHEFYGDFGTFDVELTFANNYVVGATGFLQNRKEVLPDELREKLDIKNFANTPWNSTPSIITPYDSTTRKTWKYHAENVHDFAFTADPTYRIGEVEWNGIKCISLAQEPHASKWQNAAEYTSKIIKVYSEDFGMYVYHKMIVADARDGMEYPMLTLDSGKDPTYRGLLAHEVGHNWFFGQVGNNETYRAALDEGFTQFLTMWALVKIDGEYPVKNTPKSEYVRRFKRPEKIVERRLYNTYISSAVKHTNTTLNTHSDGFNGALRHGGGYRQVYYKTGTMLYNLQYVLGEELFLEAMANYFDQWKICHPYVIDFRNSIIQYTKVDLNWFFDQWLETSKTIDYSVKSVKKGENPNEYLITFKRKGGMQMPLDFEIITKTGDHLKYHIPNNWFEKETIATVLPKWHGWDKLYPTYTAKITIPAEIADVVIDPSYRLADANMINNSKKIPLKIDFDSRLSQTSDWTKYEMYARPELWYNAYDGIKTGVHLNGHYLNHLHVFDANLWFNTGFAQGNFDSLVNKHSYDRISFRLNYNTALDKFSPGSRASLSFKLLDGLMAYKIGFDKKDKSGDNRLYMNYQSLVRNDSSDLNYLLYPELWNAGNYNNVVNIGLQHLYKYKRGTGDLNLSLRSSAIGSDYSYSQIRFTSINRNYLGKIIINTRTIIQAGSGNDPAPESQLYAAGANPEEMMDNKYIRSEIISDDSWLKYGNTTNHFHHGGGLNLRGFSGYYIAQETEEDSLDIRAVFKGNTGAAFNIEIEFQDLLGLRIRKLSKIFSLSSYLFSDLGIINYNAINESLALSDLRIDAGLGLLLSIKKFGPLEVVNPINLRFDMPFFLNRTPNTDPDFFQFRWILGIGRAF
ncbi:MAG TPA: M1 family peptidase [Flavobacteriales bacterium]|nr:M1 family peptidase [Flavobacteriales bacterium]